MVYDNKLKNRLKRIEGQVRGILGMMENEKDCKELVVQLTAARAAIDKSIALIVAENLAECLREEDRSMEQITPIINEAIELMIKSR
ncbi:metal-sensitive transcriptional regulator [Brevibacillus sp. SYSU BS000544]|uniref:metal-sensitive transcriptional regulator n=1 Tax=Brevibacillus sp. SYSU BS000544 TaxID=3416443 RepID=UPI003CE580DF